MALGSVHPTELAELAMPVAVRTYVCTYIHTVHRQKRYVPKTVEGGHCLCQLSPKPSTSLTDDPANLTGVAQNNDPLAQPSSV
jgi:hypothetical protein